MSDVVGKHIKSAPPGRGGCLGKAQSQAPPATLGTTRSPPPNAPGIGGRADLQHEKGVSLLITEMR